VSQQTPLLHLHDAADGGAAAAETLERAAQIVEGFVDQNAVAALDALLASLEVPALKVAGRQARDIADEVARQAALLDEECDRFLAAVPVA